MRIETALAKGSLTRVQRRNPQNLYHKMTLRAIECAQPVVPVEDLFCQSRSALGRSPQCGDSGIFQDPERGTQKRNPGELENLSAVAFDQRRMRLFSSSDFVNADFDFFGKTLHGAAGTRAAVEALRRLCG